MFNADYEPLPFKLENTDNLYTTYHRRKKNGKIRIITAPAEELKALQSEFSNYLYGQYKVFFDERPYVTGFLPERNIINNAEVHLNKEWVINIDLKDFFPSITIEALNKDFIPSMATLGPYGKNFHFKNLTHEEMLSLICYQGHLPQGSPCSPIIANIVAAHLIDQDIFDIADYSRFNYTRYADDLTFSTNELLGRDQILVFVDYITHIVNKSKYLKVNEQKINIKHRSQKQMVTGVLVNNKEVAVNKTLRNKLRAILHQHKIQDKPLDDKVSGILGFIKQVNALQFTKLTKDFPCKLLTLNSSNQTLTLKEAQKHMDNLNLITQLC